MRFRIKRTDMATQYLRCNHGATYPWHDKPTSPPTESFGVVTFSKEIRADLSAGRQGVILSDGVNTWWGEKDTPLVHIPATPTPCVHPPTRTANPLAGVVGWASWKDQIRYDDGHWYIPVLSLKDLMELQKDVKHDLIIGVDEADNYPLITIYDGYIE